MPVLSVCLREGTQSAHTHAENTAFMKCVLQGTVPPQPLRQLLTNLYFVYRALEAALLYNQDHPQLQAIYFPELNRADALARDLAYHYGRQQRSQLQPSPAGSAYCDRIRLIAATDPILLIAHAYTRYMGDLSGGQRIKSILRTALDLPSDRGTDLYEFPEMPTPEAKRAFKETYRQALDGLALEPDTLDRIVAEANRAFTLNRNMLQELEPQVKEALGENLFQELAHLHRPGSTVHPSERSSEPALAES